MYEVKGEFKGFDELRRAVDKAENQAFECMRRAYFRIGETFRTFHRNRHLSGRPGLIQRHGQAGIAGANVPVVSGSNLDDLNMSIGFGPPAHVYAPVHEYGSPAKNIPPRLHWGDDWDAFETYRMDILESCLQETAEVLAR